MRAEADPGELDERQVQRRFIVGSDRNQPHPSQFFPSRPIHVYALPTIPIFIPEREPMRSLLVDLMCPRRSNKAPMSNSATS